MAVCIDRQGADGAPCSAGVTCRGGLCVTLATESICSRACDAQTPCPQDWSCRAVSGGREACLPTTDGGGTGAMCQAGAAACTSGLCLMTRSGPVCTQSCADTSDCPDGWGCLTVEGRGLRVGTPLSFIYGCPEFDWMDSGEGIKMLDGSRCACRHMSDRWSPLVAVQRHLHCSNSIVHGP